MSIKSVCREMAGDESFADECMFWGILTVAIAVYPVWLVFQLSDKALGLLCALHPRLSKAQPHLEIVLAMLVACGLYALLGYLS